MEPLPVVMDTNILVAAGFNPRSYSAQLLKMVRSERLRLVWDQATRSESRRVVDQIPPLHWEEISALFTSETEFTGTTDPAAFAQIADPDDRKFAALADASGAILVSNDDHLLGVRNQLVVQVLTPAELIERMKSAPE